MPAHAPTIYDVARKAGVSVSTVSRAVNTPHLVQEKTRQRVMRAVEQLKFVPKAEASVLARKHVGSIGVLLPFFTSPSFVQRMRGVASALSARSSSSSSTRSAPGPNWTSTSTSFPCGDGWMA